MRARWAAAVGVWLCVASAACAQSLSAVDDRGVRVTLPAAPRRIVSLMPANTEILFALGLGGRVVGVTDYCDYPPEVRKLPKVGGMNTSIEKVLALRPDLVVASASGNRKAIEALAAVRGGRVPVFAIDPKTLPTLHAAIRAIGRVTGRADRAEALDQKLQARAAAVAARVKRQPTRPRVLFVLQAEPLWVVGSGNFMDELIAAAGGVNVARGAGQGYRPWTLERVVAANPDVILTTMEGLDRFRGRPGWSAVKAVRSGAVHRLGYEAVRPSPRLVDAIERVERLLRGAVGR